MMWPLLAILTWNCNMSGNKMVASASTLMMEISNVLVMSALVLLLTHLMQENNLGVSEKKTSLLIILVGVCVGFSFFMDSALLYLVLMEMTVIPLGYMIIITSKDTDKVESVKFMVLMNTLGSVPFMVFTIWSESFLMMESPFFSIHSNLGVTILMLLFIMKTPMFLLHVWLTKAHVTASGNCSMILASIMIKLGTVGVLKFYKNFGESKGLEMILSICLMGAFYLTLIMFRFFDTKTLIAMSSVLHMAMIVPILMLKKSNGVISALMMMTAHGVISYYLFYLITTKYEMTESRTSVMMKSSESHDKSFVMVLMTFMFLNMGLPPFMNFFSECSFLFSMAHANSISAQLCLALVMFSSVMFTMQLNTNNNYGEVKKVTKKLNPVALIMKSAYYFMWSYMIIMTM